MRVEADIDGGWTIGGKPNGGYLLAMMGRAAAADTDFPDVVAASAHYLHSPDPGPVTIVTEVLRAGRSASQVRARLEQDGRPCVEALVTASRLPAHSAPYWDGGVPVVDIPPRERCVKVPPHGPSGIEVALLEQVDIRLDPRTAGFMDGRPAGVGELRGWLALPGDAPFDPAWLLFAVDAFPPGTFDVELSGWVPTLELTAYVRARPAPGPVQVLQRARLIEGQRVDEACFVWDATGRLVAQATQLAGIRLGSS